MTKVADKTSKVDAKGDWKKHVHWFAASGSVVQLTILGLAAFTLLFPITNHLAASALIQYGPVGYLGATAYRACFHWDAKEEADEIADRYVKRNFIESIPGAMIPFLKL